jgi:hypothetical protein
MKYAVCAMATVIAASFVVLVVWSIASDQIIQWFHPPYWVEYRVDLVVDDEPVEISGGYQCTARARVNEVTDIIPQVAYRANRRLAGKRLPDNAFVHVTVPAFCYLPATFRKDFYPYIVWIDDADNPTVAETYVSGNYFDTPNPRVRILGMDFWRVEEPKTAYSGIEDYRVSDISRFEGFHAYAVSEDDWSQYPKIVSHVTAMQSVGEIPWSLVDDLAKRYFFWPHTDWWISGVGVDRFSGVLPSPDAPPHYFAYRNGAIVRALLRKNKVFEIDTSNSGYLAYYRREKPLAQNKKAKRSIVLLLAGSEIVLNYTGRLRSALYDPASRHIYLIRTNSSDSAHIPVLNWSRSKVGG